LQIEVMDADSGDAPWRHDRRRDRMSDEKEDSMRSQESVQPPNSAPAADGRDQQKTGGYSPLPDEAQDEGRTSMQIDYIEEAIEESFPASDPPASTPASAIGAPRREAAKDGE
jgi:hypothetical protein